MNGKSTEIDRTKTETCAVDRSHIFTALNQYLEIVIRLENDFLFLLPGFLFELKHWDLYWIFQFFIVPAISYEKCANILKFRTFSTAVFFILHVRFSNVFP